MKDSKRPASSPLFLAAAVVPVAVLVFLYYRYSFLPAAPYLSLGGESNPHPTILSLFVEHALYLLGAGLIAVAALSGGLFFMKLFHVASLPPLEEVVCAFALGLGVLSLSTLLLGLAGFLTPAAAGPLVVVLGGLGAGALPEFIGRIRGVKLAALSPMERFFAAVVAAAALVTVVYAFAPPVYFDTLEYHLGAPARYFAAGRISFLTSNVYSNFPSACEMLYLVSMCLTGSKMAGAVLGNILNAYVAIAAVTAAFCLGRWISSRAAGLFAAAALILSPGFFQVATGYYVEPLQTLYTILALLAVGRFLQSRARAVCVLAAALAGLAMGVKYPAALFVAVPLALAVLLARTPPASRVKSFAVFSGIAIAVVAPWLLKNIIFTGNPVYPLLYSVFGGRDWSPLQDARWAFAHTPKGGLALEQWARHVFALFFSNENVTLLSFAFVPLAFAKRPLPKRILYVFLYGVLYVLLWFVATHRIDRFALPAFAVLGAVSGAGFVLLRPGWVRRAACALVVLLALTNLLYVSALYGHAVKMDLSVPLFGQYDRFLSRVHPAYDSWVHLDETVPPMSRVLLVAEAETFYLDVDFAATTVFDVKPLETMYDKASGDPAALAAAVKAAGFDYVFVNWATFRRQQETYSFTFADKTLPGYSRTINPALFDSMAGTGRIKLVYSSGPDVYPGVPAYVLYSVE